MFLISSESALNALSLATLHARIDVAIARAGTTELPDDRLAPFVTNETLNRVDDYVREAWIRLPDGWNYQKGLARVVADLTGAGPLPCHWQTEKIGQRQSTFLLQTYSKEVQRIKKNSKGSRRDEKLRAAAEECWFCEHGGRRRRRRWRRRASC